MYFVFHFYMSILSVGQTHLAPTQRMRKHVAYVAAGVDNSILHRLMATSELAHLGIGVREYVGDGWWMAVRERAWWWQLRQWAGNDIPLGIPDQAAGVTPSTRGWLNERVLIESLKGTAECIGQQ